MYIKQVIISGFRSFRSQNEIEPFRFVQALESVTILSNNLLVLPIQSEAQRYSWKKWKWEEVCCFLQIVVACD